ncbi:hypothetical protein [Inquilinus sp.]|uniref:hypothetical protein n=1 Tax=Inquilinus sp. TaxID=1932117 RepID=UPI0031DB0F17
MPNDQNYSLTETEILALELHRQLYGHCPYAGDIEVLVEELERRERRSAAVNGILEEGRRFLAAQRR